MRPTTGGGISAVTGHSLRLGWLLICERWPILSGRFASAVLAFAVSGVTSPRWRFCCAGLCRRGDQPRRRVVFCESIFKLQLRMESKRLTAKSSRVRCRCSALALGCEVFRLFRSRCSWACGPMSLRYRLQVSVLRFSVVSVALGSDGNTLFPKIHRADSNGGPPGAGRWRGGGGQPGGSGRTLRRDHLPQLQAEKERFFVWLLPCCGSVPVPLAGVASVEASDSELSFTFNDYRIP